MFSPVTSPNSLRLRPPPPPPFHSSPTSLPSPTSPSIRSPLTSPLSATVYATAETTCIALSPTAVISPPSLYEILGISMGATEGEIKTAYRRLARISHPDVKDSSGEEFMKIHAAYSTLSDPGKRADYDRRLFRTHRSRSYSSVRPSSSYNGFNGYSGRNWETDQCW
ncbi:chaperone protein dnaJ 11, chloroplastic-like [Cynara cardunculus var. scolymus]|uniref:DnaJ domain-containing protein n=1 Tax=Cynara cardunculus var. scolymus TaxID=59895 RepID=A0A103Y5K6_CYNCS|nr:chaperone protein dnaJ 11, chloroplastic-like [Cynara cardunculus var. scolymus]KVI02930.1 DnaJ domain-containing protein [Cynara cardunculus var. scolymus]